jgi:hypothetical protein
MEYILMTMPQGREDPSETRYRLELFLLDGEFDLYEDGQLIAAVDRKQVAVELSYGKVIFYCWGEEWSRSWRITGLRSSPGGVILDCTKQMGLARSTLELLRGTRGDTEAPSRRDYCTKLSRLIECLFSGISVQHAIVARDDRNNISGNYARLIMTDAASGRSSVIAGIGASPGEHQTVVDRMLGAGLVWADQLGKTGRTVDRLFLFAPAKRVLTLGTRLTSVRQDKLKVSLYEVDEGTESAVLVEPFDQGDLAENFGKSARRAIWPDRRALRPAVRAMVDSIVQIAPDFIDAHIRPGSVVLSIRGLPVARVLIGTPRASFGLEGALRDLTEYNRADLESLISEVISTRTPWSEDRNSPIYRGYGERWLESAILRDACRIDTNIDSRYVYSQVPIYRGEQRTFIDLLAITVTGRLVVMELKVSEDSDFPLQALDYCLKVGWHQQRGDFKRRSYFKGVVISESLPLLYLVAPLFRFHATTALIGGSISERIPVYRIGINDDWRAGVRVLLREKLN